MMLCTADFDELFPLTARTDRTGRPGREPSAPGKACIDRWEDDGGTPRRIPPRGAAPVPRPASDRFTVPDPAHFGLAFAMMPATAAFGAASAMISAYDRMTRG